jgi:hypothetical protein
MTLRNTNKCHRAGSCTGRARNPPSYLKTTHTLWLTSTAFLSRKAEPSAYRRGGNQLVDYSSGKHTSHLHVFMAEEGMGNQYTNELLEHISQDELTANASAEEKTQHATRRLKNQKCVPSAGGTPRSANGEYNMIWPPNSRQLVKKAFALRSQTSPQLQPYSQTTRIPLHKELSYSPRRFGFNSIARTRLHRCTRRRLVIASLKVVELLEDDHDDRLEATTEATVPLKAAALLVED